MAQGTIERPSVSKTLKSHYATLTTSSISAPVDQGIDVSSTRPSGVADGDIVALVFIGFSPASSWNSTLICKEVLFNSSNKPYGFGFRTTGSTPQSYVIRVMWLYYS